MVSWEYSLYKNKEDKVLHFNYDYKDQNNMIVCWQDVTDYGREIRKFTMFKDPIAFMDFEKTIPADHRCFFEVIMGKRERKPYFDIDVSLTEYPEMTKRKMNSLVELLIENIKDFLESYAHKILVFTSHREGKLSYHVIVDGVFLETNEDSRLFAEKVMPKEMFDFVDSRVYNSVQQLRMVNSKKYGKNNKKVIDFSLCDNFFIPKGIRGNSLEKEKYVLYASIITFTAFCKKVEMEKKPKTLRKATTGCEIDEALELLGEKYDNFEYKTAHENNSSILVELVSKESYHCNIHNRVHENENAYIVIKGHMKNVWFDCRRIEQHETDLSKEFIGFLFKKKKIDKNLACSFSVSELN